MDNVRTRLLVVGMGSTPTTFVQQLVRGLPGAGIDVTIAARRPPGGELRWLRMPPEWWSISLVSRSLRLAILFFQAMLRSPRDLATIAAKLGASPDFRTRLRASYRLLPFVGRRWDVIYFPWNSAAIDYLDLFELQGNLVLSCRGAQVNIAPHNPERIRIRDGLRQTFERAAAVHCVSAATQDSAIRLGLDPKKSRVIFPAVDTLRFYPPEDGAAGEKEFRIISTGSLIWRKGFEYAFSAVRELVRRGIPVQFEIIGDGHDSQRLQYTINDLELASHVALRGRLAPHQVSERLQDADVFLLSSLSEGISNAVLEALASGLPIVTTDCGGMREAVRSGIDGFVVPGRQPVEMADALQKLWNDPDLRKRMGQAGRRRAVELFDLEIQIMRFAELFKEIADGANHAN
jgi:glycosyltransferase involved in cell wall biosynthesis